MTGLPKNAGVILILESESQLAITTQVLELADLITAAEENYWFASVAVLFSTNNLPLLNGEPDFP